MSSLLHASLTVEGLCKTYGKTEAVAIAKLKTIFSGARHAHDLFRGERIFRVITET
jgi:hypothetical protein